MRLGWGWALVVGAMLWSCKSNGPQVTPVIEDGYGGGSASVDPRPGGNGGEGGGGPVSITSCMARVDGTLCPGSTDPLQSERCFEGGCVGTYVAPSGSDSNPGTRERPKATVAAALQVATALGALDTVPRPVPVYVGAGDYAEDLSIPDRVDLQGGYDATRWSREVSVHRSRLKPSDPRGLRFSDAMMTRDSARMSGFVILGASASSDSSALTVENGAQPTLEYLEVMGGVTPAVSTALSVIGAHTRPYVSNSGLTAGAGAISIGLRVSDGAGVELDRSYATGGSASQASSGAVCVMGCPGSAFTDVTLTGGAAPESQGLWLQGGNTSGVFVQAATIRATGLGAHLLSRAVGARLTGPCSGQPATILGATITGANGSNQHAAGVEVTDCALDLRNSTITGAARGTVDTAAGVTCDGASSCTLMNDTVFAAGLAAELRDAAVGVRLSGSGLLSSSFVVVGHCAATSGGEVTGVSISTGPVRLENNVVLGGGCDVSSALAVRLPSPGLSGEPEIVNNHFDGVGRPTGFSAGVLLERARGVFLNNTMVAGAGRDAAAFHEQEPGADPSALRNNNLWGTVLYVDDGNLLRDVQSVNGMALGPAASGNISGDPQVDGDYRLGPTSPNRGAGQLSAGSVLAPLRSRLGHDRPFPAGSLPDIGPDERD